MKLTACAIRDSAMNAFLRPIFVPSVGMAVRSFMDECCRVDGDLIKHLEDYELFELGTFDEESGRFDNLDHARSLARGIDYRKDQHVQQTQAGKEG